MRIDLRWLAEFVDLPSLKETCELLTNVGVEVEGLSPLPPAAEVESTPLPASELAVVHLNITPNRPDLLAHVGVARELAAATGKRLKPLKIRLVEKGPDISLLARVLVDDVTACKRYAARVIRGLSVGPSPLWLQNRLAALGERSINNVVDATNLVLFELGQPLHAFDLAKIPVEAGLPTLRVRRAKEGETLKTLDGVVRNLSVQDLVIADPNRPVALAGIMGGADTEVSNATSSIILESAYFEPMVVRHTSKSIGLRSEASHRFQGGTDPAIVLKALDRCAQLLAELAGGEVAKGYLEVTQRPEATLKEITVRFERLAAVLGLSLTPQTVIELLDPLEIRCIARNEVSLRFTAPTFRPDLTREIDLIEEVARRYGYQKIPERLPDSAQDYVYDVAKVNLSERARATLLAHGCSEVLTYGFGSPSKYTREVQFKGELLSEVEPLSLLNPLGEEMRALRTSLLPGILGVLAYNQRHGSLHQRLFEIGTTFHRVSTSSWTADLAAEEPRTPDVIEARSFREVCQESAKTEAQILARSVLTTEDIRLGLVLQGGRYAGAWFEAGAQLDFYDLKGVLENLFSSLALPLSVAKYPGSKESAALWFNPAACGVLKVGEQVVGILGTLHPEYVRSCDLSGEIFAAELSLTELAKLNPSAFIYESLPKFPRIRRDVCIVAPLELSAQALGEFLQTQAAATLPAGLVKEVRLFDVYRGANIPPGKVSLAFAVEYLGKERTLTDEEVNQAFSQVLAQLTAAFPVEVRVK